MEREASDPDNSVLLVILVACFFNQDGSRPTPSPSENSLLLCGRCGREMRLFGIERETETLRPFYVRVQLLWLG